MRRRSPLDGLPYSVTALWPAPAQLTVRRRPRHGETGYFVVPSVANARLLVPIGVPGAERMLVRHGGGPVTRAARSLWGRAVNSVVSTRLPIRQLCVRPDPGGIEHHLTTHLDTDIRMGVLVGPPRANAKPVIQLFDGAGATVAFAKVGVTPTVAELVEREASALRMVAAQPRRTFQAPCVISADRWRQLPVLVQQALPLAQSRLAPQEPPVAVMAEIAGLAGIAAGPIGTGSVAEPLPSAGRWFGLDLGPFDLLRRRLHPVDGCPIGSWHGDFGPWNMATDGSTTQVWDWERFEQDVPVGFDAAHYRTQKAVATAQEPSAAWQLVTRDVANVLTAAGQPDRHAAVVAAAYVVSICRRYVRDSVDGPTPALRRRIDWLAGFSVVAATAIENDLP